MKLKTKYAAGAGGAGDRRKANSKVYINVRICWPFSPEAKVALAELRRTMASC